MAHLVRRTVGIGGWRRRFERSDEIFEQISFLYWRNYSATSCASKSMKVAIIGASGKVGRCLALCLKQSPLIDELAIYDSKPVRGLLLELSHMDTRCKSCTGGSSQFELEEVLQDAKIVAVALQEKSLDEEACSLQKVVPSIASCSPKALVALVSPSVNILLPMMFELFKKVGVFECNRLFGVLSLYQTRANGLAADVLNVSPEFVTVPVIGGGCPRSCVALFSQTRPCSEFTTEEQSRLMLAMKSADARIAEAYRVPHTSHSSESSALCTGFAATRFCVSLCKALRDERGVVECAYARSCLVPELKYVGAPLALGPCGIQKHLGVPRLTNQECSAFYEALPEIKKAIAVGESLALGTQSSTERCPPPPRCSALPPCQPEITA